ncbi:hypothetical protein Tsubulata_014122 [Turnera subulata]|uniref:Uncharacterized protein n=1 Tax=Turnera subulata TaxID=218843 RepID=A0A9Q0GJX1_9ROSI|nr:hypothetical protein Tsubulata_014122 [Turnera subulata]
MAPTPPRGCILPIHLITTHQSCPSILSIPQYKTPLSPHNNHPASSVFLVPPVLNFLDLVFMARFLSLCLSYSCRSASDLHVDSRFKGLAGLSPGSIMFVMILQLSCRSMTAAVHHNFRADCDSQGAIGGTSYGVRWRRSEALGSIYSSMEADVLIMVRGCCCCVLGDRVDC